MMQKYIKLFSLSALLMLSVQSFAWEEMDNGLSGKVHVVTENFDQIDVNKADAKTFAKLPGIGLKKARAIVHYREAHGEFTDIEQLTKVKGISDKLLLKIQQKVAVY